MITEQDIQRINELYHKSKEGNGLTEEEKAEQATLRRAYIDAVKANLGVYLKDIKNASKQDEEDAKDAFSSKEKAQKAMAATDAELSAEKAMAETDAELKEEK
ncbi:MAG TPA: DUF896 family protein [Oribacterium sp.]|nr:DUF896 family protein [Oribacterium sp.]